MPSFDLKRTVSPFRGSFIRRSKSKKEDSDNRSKSLKEETEAGGPLARLKSHRLSWNSNENNANFNHNNNNRESLSSLSSLEQSVNTSCELNDNLTFSKVNSENVVKAGFLDSKSSKTSGKKSKTKNFKPYHCLLTSDGKFCFYSESDEKARIVWYLGKCQCQQKQKAKCHQSNWTVRFVTSEGKEIHQKEMENGTKRKRVPRSKYFEVIPPQCSMTNTEYEMCGRLFLSTSKDESESWVDKLKEVIDDVRKRDKSLWQPLQEKEVTELLLQANVIDDNVRYMEIICK